MNKEEIVHKIAFLQCAEFFKESRPCTSCKQVVTKMLDKTEYIDAELIETMVLAIRNNSGDYSDSDYTPLEVSFAFSILEVMIPEIMDRVKNGHS